MWTEVSMTDAGWAVRKCHTVILQGAGAGVELHLVLHCPAALADPEKAEGGRLYDGLCATIRQALLASAEAGAVREARRRLLKAEGEADRLRQALPGLEQAG